MQIHVVARFLPHPSVSSAEKRSYRLKALCFLIAVRSGDISSSGGVWVGWRTRDHVRLNLIGKTIYLFEGQVQSGLGLLLLPLAPETLFSSGWQSSLLCGQGLGSLCSTLRDRKVDQ